MFKKITTLIVSALIVCHYSYAETNKTDLYQTLIEPVKTYESLNSSPTEELVKIFSKKYSAESTDPNSTTNSIDMFKSNDVFEKVKFHSYVAKNTDNKKVVLYKIVLNVNPDWMKKELGFNEETQLPKSLLCQKQLNLVSEIMEEKYKTKFNHIFYSKGNYLKAKLEHGINIDLYCLNSNGKNNELNNEQVNVSIINTVAVDNKLEEEKTVKKELISKNLKHF